VSDQVTTISLIKYEGLLSKVWAFGMMQFAHKYISDSKGLTFYKLMGSGKGAGFNPLPDWSTYAVLCAWKSMDTAENFINKSNLMKKYESRASSITSYYMSNILSKGKWSGASPFITGKQVAKDGKLAVITRATIKLSKLYSFWKYVPTSERPLANNTGLLYKKGIGEVPLLQMATFSIWKDIESLKQYAYASQEHKEAIRKTRELNWYTEELFSRFLIIKEDIWQKP